MLSIGTCVYVRVCEGVDKSDPFNTCPVRLSFIPLISSNDVVFVFMSSQVFSFIVLWQPLNAQKYTFCRHSFVPFSSSTRNNTR